MGRRLVLALVVLLGTSSCSLPVMDARLDYLHSPSTPPPQGTVVIAPVQFPTYWPGSGTTFVADAYAWLGLLGYEKAASDDRSDYVVTFDLTFEPVCAIANEDGDCSVTVFLENVHFVMKSRIEDPQQNANHPVVEIMAAGGRTGSIGETDFSLVLELALADFPGVEGRTARLTLERKGDLLCVDTTIPLIERLQEYGANRYAAPVNHCREPNAPAGVLTAPKT
jgi:hypothetical protein